MVKSIFDVVGSVLYDYTITFVGLFYDNVWVAFQFVKSSSFLDCEVVRFVGLRWSV